MDQSEKSALTAIGKLPYFQESIRKLTLEEELEPKQRTYLLACGILFLKHYNLDKRHRSYADFAYYVFLKYSVTYKHYDPLFDFAVNFGFYPIAKTIVDDRLSTNNLINTCFIDVQLEAFKNPNDYIETQEQFVESRKFLADDSLERSYLAPTSFGKSSLIVDTIRSIEGESKIVIVVPTKSLLLQTYQMIRESDLGKKIIIHDEMYNNEESFIAIFTQERSLRLLSRIDIYFDVIFIDEAHNILGKDPRSILLSRLIAKNRNLNLQQKLIYLSPLVDDVRNLRVNEDQSITEHSINFTIKEPEIFEYRLNNEVYKYNRFVNQFYPLGNVRSELSYVLNNSGRKNFLYNYRPIKIEQLAKELCENLSPIEANERISEVDRILKREVHKDFYALKYLPYGVVYLHGKLPDIIKEYLEFKYKSIPEIRYIIANSVILEGMNLPIDTLFIYNTYNIHGKGLSNLIGRVNRLNNIFTNSNADLSKLLPKIHFVNNERHYRTRSNMSEKIKLLRSRVFKDSVQNPTLDSFDIDDSGLSEKAKADALLIKSNEDFISKVPSSEFDKLKVYLIETGIFEFYQDLNTLTEELLARIRRIKQDIVPEWNNFSMMEKINYFFLERLNSVSDYEVNRLANPAAQGYYENFILVSQKKALNENISSQFQFFKDRVNSPNSKFYFGRAYGEESYDTVDESHNQPKEFVDLSTKSDPELINLAIVKIKMEEDFVSFKLNKLIVMLFDYQLISRDDYNLYIYGTTDQQKIDLTKLGLSISLISRLDSDGQLDNLYLDEYNNLKGNSDFENFLNSVDDFYRFEINRYLN